MKRILELLGLTRRSVSTHDEGHVTGDVAPLHDLLAEIVAKLDALSRTAATGVSDEFEALVHGIADDVVGLKRYATAMSARIEALEGPVAEGSGVGVAPDADKAAEGMGDQPAPIPGAQL